MIYSLIFRSFDLFSAALLALTTRLEVCSGPFRRMAYIRGAVGSSLLPKILGTYEVELTPWIEQLPRFDRALDIGAAEGYYAVGLLYRNICRQVTAWEMTSEGRDLMKSLAAANGVTDRLEIRGRCGPKELADEVGATLGEVLVIIDCEGYEGDLLEPLPATLAARCTFIIETHNPMNPGVHGRLVSLLQSTHEITEVLPRRRSADDLLGTLPGVLGLLGLPVLRRLAMAERRTPGLGWLICQPKANKPPSE